MTLVIDNLECEGLLQRNIDRQNPQISTLANTITTWDVTTNTLQIFSGTTAGQRINLPNATTLTNGWYYEIHNTGTQPITVRRNDGTTVEITVQPSTVAFIKLVNNSTSNGTWSSFQTLTQSVASGLIYKDASASNQVTTTSSTYVDLPNMTVTVDATGYYLVLFNGVSLNSNNGSSQFYIINVNGTDVSDSERQVTTAGGARQIATLQKVVNVSSGQIIKIRWRRSANTASTFERTITALKVG